MITVTMRELERERARGDEFDGFSEYQFINIYTLFKNCIQDRDPA